MIAQKAIGNGSTLKRHWRVPPPLLRDAQAPGPEGLNVIRELSSQLGATLWKSLRSVLLWARVSPQERKGLFPPEAHDRRVAGILSLEAEPELEEPLLTLSEVLSKPDEADPEAVGLACSRVGRWADREGHPLTAVEFYQAAALTCPADARHALQVGRAVRDRAQYSRAEAWLQRAVGLGRQARDWDTYIRAYIALGKMMRQRGTYPAARRNLLKALRRATRQGLRNVEGMALHDLFVLEDECGNEAEARKYAAGAVRAYGQGHRLLPALAHDVAYFWLQRGYYDQALPVFFQVLPRVSGTHRTVALGSLARAAGASGDEQSHDWAGSLLFEAEEGPGLAEAWVEAARGAVALERWDDARIAAGRAEALARRRGEEKVRYLAEGVLQSVDSEERARQHRQQRPHPKEADEETRELARALVSTLQASPVPR